MSLTKCGVECKKCEEEGPSRCSILSTIAGRLEGAKDTMDGLSRVGRFFFAAAMAAFGVQYIYFASGGRGPIPGPPWMPGSEIAAWLAGIGFVVVGLCIAAGKMARVAATLVGAALLLRVLVLHLPGLIAHVHDPGQWTPMFEVLGIAGGAWILGRSLPADSLRSPEWDTALEMLFHVGRFFVVSLLVVVGVQHFMYAAFIATLITAWIPWHLFWAYFVGVAFFGAALSIATGVMARAVEVLLGTMFFLWVLVLHAPRVAATPNHGNEWTSLFIALAMSGAAFALAGESRE